MDKINYSDINSKTIDHWIENGWVWGIPITHEEYMGGLKMANRMYY
jgi:hypothetical protein